MIWEDFRYGVRMLAKSPGFTAAAVITLALGIGANTAIFSVVNAVVLRPLPYKNPERLVYLTNKYSSLDAPLSPPDFVEYSRRTEIFQQMSVLRLSGFNLTGSDAPVRVEGCLVSASFFEMLGVQPALGRTFTPEDDRPGGGAVVVISDGLWKRRFAADPQVVGTQIISNGRKYTVIGVAPEWFRYPETAELWAPVALTPQQTAAIHRGNQYLTALARLDPELTLQQAQARLDAIAVQVQERFPRQYPKDSGWRLKLTSMPEATVGDIRPTLLVLLGAVGFLLLVACANLAGLMLARMAERQREIGIRRALGASRLRLVWQLLAEGLTLAAAGGFAGFLLAAWGIDTLKFIGPAHLVRWREVGIDARILGFTAGVSLISGLLFALWPAWHNSRSELHQSLKEGGRGSAGSSRRRATRILVVSEIALTLVLLIGAGLMTRTLIELAKVDPGFRSDHLLTMRLLLPRMRYDTPRINDFFSRVLGGIRALPGVESAGATNALPFSGTANSGTFEIENRLVPDGRSLPHADIRVVSPGYFEAMRIPLRRGRYFGHRDGPSAVRVAIIDETLAKVWWPDDDPLGKRITTDRRRTDWIVIVGVVGSLRHESLDAAPKETLYFPVAQRPSRLMTLAIRTSGEPSALANAARRQVWSVDKDQPVYDVRTMDQRMSGSLARHGFAVTLLSLFSLMALVLATVGIYGTVSYAVAARTREIGIRMALGARAGDVLRLVVRQGMSMALAGIAAGVLGALMLTRVLGSLLYGVSPTDPLTFLAVGTLLISVAAAAAYVPARRAAKINPISALRYE